jgi:hypothetical protein
MHTKDHQQGMSWDMLKQAGTSCNDRCVHRLEKLQAARRLRPGRCRARGKPASSFASHERAAQKECTYLKMCFIRAAMMSKSCMESRPPRFACILHVCTLPPS